MHVSYTYKMLLINYALQENPSRVETASPPHGALLIEGRKMRVDACSVI